jgi:hypothetical protein
VSVVPIEVKSGKDYKIHSAIERMTETEDYAIVTGYVLSNEREIVERGKIVYMPVYGLLAL